MNDSKKQGKKCLTCIFYDLLSTKRSNIGRSRLEFGQNPVGSLQSALQSSQGLDLACRKKRKSNKTSAEKQAFSDVCKKIISMFECIRH